MHKIFKKGMTLGELCIVFAIMGVVASMTLIAAKPYDKSIKYAYEKVYSTLNTAFYNAQLNLTDELRADDTQYNKTTNDCSADNTKLCIDGTFPMNTYTLCYMLTQYINTSQSTVGANCKADAIPVGGELPTTVDDLLKTNKPHITASNGVKYWIISFNKKDYMKPTYGSFATTVVKGKDSAGHATYGDYTTRTIVRFYGIAADLNGSMGPNTTDQRSPKRIADIVGFAVLDTGDVVPIGMPRHDKRYTTAEVIGPNGEPIPNLPPLSIFQASRLAWAYDIMKDVNSDTIWRSNLFISTDNPLSLGFVGDYCIVSGTTSTKCLAGSGNAQDSPFYYKLNDIYKTTSKKQTVVIV